MGDHETARSLLSQIWESAGGDRERLELVAFSGAQALPSPFAVSDLAAATIGAAGLALSELAELAGDVGCSVHVDRTLASGWFDIPVAPGRPLTPPQPRPQNPWLTEFETADGRWLRVQAMFPGLRKRLVDGLGTNENLDEVSAEIRRHTGEELERHLVDACAAVAINRTFEEWQVHPQGAAVGAEPPISVVRGTSGSDTWTPTQGRLLAGIRVLDLSRVFAGPTATRFLAACGAEVLRLEAPGSDESVGLLGDGNELGLGKRWAFLDLKTEPGRERFLELLAEADVLVHGYRPGWLDDLGLGDEVRAATRPGLVDIGLNAYGWTGPWRMRRGFDSLVQFSTGLADATTAWARADPAKRTPLAVVGGFVDASRPRHLPVEALDFGTGYQIATAAIRGLTVRASTGRGSTSRLSLARTAALIAGTRADPHEPRLALPVPGPLEERVYSSGQGPVRRLAFPVEVARNPLFWERPYELAGAARPVWSTPARGAFRPGASVGM